MAPLGPAVRTPTRGEGTPPRQRFLVVLSLQPLCHPHPAGKAWGRGIGVLWVHATAGGAAPNCRGGVRREPGCESAETTRTLKPAPVALITAGPSLRDVGCAINTPWLKGQREPSAIPSWGALWGWDASVGVH